MPELQAARGASLTTSDSGRGHRVLAILVASVALAVDQISKATVVAHIAPGHAPIQVVGDLLRITLTRNPGAAFSTGTSITPVITVVAIVAALVTGWFLRRVHNRTWAWGLGLLLAGILGNLADRLFRAPGPFHGHVVDFLEFPHWPVFNVADVCINVAALLILIQVLRGVGLDGVRRDNETDDTDDAEGSQQDRSVDDRR